METTPRGVIVLLVLAIATGLWAVGARLDRSPARDDAVSPDPASRPAGDSANPPASEPPEPIPLATPAGKLDGRVTDPLGRPVAGARVVHGPNEVRTDADGRFSIARAHGPLRIEKAGWFPVEIPARPGRPPPGEADGTLDLVLVPGHRLHGRVEDGDGRPVAGATVHIARDLDGGAERVSTDDGGRWESPLLPPGDVHVLVRHPEYQAAARVVALSAAAAAREVVLRLVPGTPLEVEVVDPSGRPLPDARVELELLPRASEATGIESRRLGRTGDLGRIVTCRPPDRPARVRARLAGYRGRVAEVDGSGVRLALSPAPVLAAQAIDATTGLPVPPVHVELELRRDGAWRPAPDRGILWHSLARGKIRAGLPPLEGTYRLVVEARGRRGVSPPVAFDGEISPEPLLVRLERERRLRGLVHAGGTPVEDAEVRILRGAGTRNGATVLHGVEVPAPPRVVFRTTTGAGGRFAFPAVPDGPFRLAVEAAGYAPFVSAPLRPESADGREIPVALTAPGRISGRVVPPDGGERGVPDVPVLLVARGRRTRVAWTDSEGDWRFDDVAPGDGYGLVLGDPGEPVDAAGLLASTRPSPATGVALGIALRPGEHVRLDLAARPTTRGSLEGRITVDGTPRSAEARLVPLEGGGRSRRVRADEGGRFLARGLAPGPWRAEGITLPFAREVGIEPAARVRLQIDLATVDWEVVAVSSRTGRRVASGRVELRPAGGRGAARFHGRSPARSRPVRDGLARFEGLFPGTYRLRVRAPGHVLFEGRTEIEADGGRGRVVLEPGHAVSFRLVDPDGRPFRGEAEIVVREGGRRLHRARRRLDGRVELPALPAGSYEVTVRSDRYRLRRRIEIGPGPRPPPARAPAR